MSRVCSRRGFIACASACLIAAMAPRVARAADIYGAIYAAPYQINNRTYTGRAWLQTLGSGNVNGRVTVNSSGTPVADIGGRSDLYLASGLLVGSLTDYARYYAPSFTVTNPHYNIYDSAVTTYCYAAGEMHVQYHEGGTYLAFSLPPTGTTAVLSVDEQPSLSTYSTSPNGLVYGSGLASYRLGYSPDLIAAKGIGGEEGYIRREDNWVPRPASIEEAALLYSEPRFRDIPLYSLDGVTRIGTFRLHYGSYKE